MLLNEFMESVSSDNAMLELDIMRITAYTERAEREYEINLKQADLKVLTESGTVEDLEYLYEAAGEGLASKFAKGIAKIKESAVKFFKTIKDKITALLGGKNKEAIDNLENKIKGSKAANGKIKIFDIDKRKKVHQKTKSKLKKELSLAKIGKSTKERVETILREHKKALAAVSLSTVTILGGIKLYKSRSKKAIQGTAEILDEFMNVVETTTYKEVGKSDPSYSDKVRNKMYNNSGAEMSCIRALLEVSREEARDETTFLGNVMSTIRSGISSITGIFKKGKTGGNAAFESFDDLLDEDAFNEFSIYDDYEDTYEESTFDDDFDDIFGESEEDYEYEDTYEESTFDDDFDDIFGESEEDYEYDEYEDMYAESYSEDFEDTNDIDRYFS